MVKKSDSEIVLVGDELLKGERTDAHLAWLAREMLRLGAHVARAHAVADTVEEIADVVRECLGRTRVLIVTGGLGPTPDDVTREGVARALGVELEFHEPSWKAITSFFAARGRSATATNRRQAQFPRGSDVIPNDLGTAPGFAVEAGGTTVVVLPGPPVEVRRMFDEAVRDRLARLFDRPPVRVETFRTIGVGESTLRELLGDQLDALTAYRVSSMPSRMSVDIVLTQKPGAGERARLDDEADRVERALREKVGNYFFERGERSLCAVVEDLLARRGETVAVAESLTGGLVGKQMTDVPGSSASFVGDVVAYADSAKVALLGVQPETLGRFGAVSEETCTEMAHGVRHRLGATWGLATTGIAGPSGGTPKKPVGLTFIGVSWDGGCLVKRKLYTGTRDDVRRRAAGGVVWMLFDRLNATAR